MKKFLSLIIYFILVIVNITVSGNRIDSLEIELNKAGEKDKIVIYNELALEYSIKIPQKAIEISEKALLIAKKYKNTKEESNALLHSGRANAIMGNYQNAVNLLNQSLAIKLSINDKKGTANIYQVFGNLYKITGDAEKSLESNLKALKIREEIKDSNGISSSLNNIGIIYKYWGNYSKALDYYFKSMLISEKLEHKELMSNTLTNIGHIYLELGRSDEANKFYLKSLKFKEELNDVNGVTGSYLNIGNVFSFNKQYDSALAYYQKAYQRSEVNNNFTTVCNSLNNIGEAYNFLDKKDSAIFYYKKALESALKLNDKSIVSATMLNLGEVYLRLRKFDLANQFLAKSLEISRETNNAFNLKTIYKVFSDYYDSTKNYKQALYFDNLYVQIKDSIFNENMNKRIQDMQLSNELDKKEKEIELLKKDKEILEKDNIINRNDKVIYIFITIFICIIVAVTFIRYRTKLKAEEKLIKLNSDKDRYLAIIQKDISQASEYVSSLLPKLLKTENISTNWHFVPSSSLGGDSFGYHFIDNEHFAIYLFDVSGHGIGAALHSVSIQNTIKYQSLANTDFKNPVEVLHSLNNIYRMKEHNNLFFTIWYGVYNISTSDLCFASAGHPGALYISEDGTNKLLITKNPLIGGFNEHIFIKDTYHIQKPGVIYIFSDGVYEIRHKNKYVWYLDDLYNFLSKNNNSSNDCELEDIYNLVKELRFHEHLEDDFSLLKIKINSIEK